MLPAIENYEDYTHDSAQRLGIIEDALKLYNNHGSRSDGDKPLDSFAKALIAERGSHSLRDIGVTMKYRQDALVDLNGYMEHLTAAALMVRNPRVTTNLMLEHTRPYHSAIIATWSGRCFFVTDDGKPGVASQACRPGDKVCIFFDAETPINLRSVDNKDSFLLVSDAYLDGVMWSEAFEGRDESFDRHFLLD